MPGHLCNLYPTFVFSLKTSRRDWFPFKLDLLSSKAYFESNVVHLNWHFLEICHSYSSFCSSRGLEDINYLAILWDIFIFAKILYQRDKKSEGIQSLCSRKIPFVNPKIIAAPCKASLLATLKIYMYLVKYINFSDTFNTSEKYPYKYF